MNIIGETKPMGRNRWGKPTNASQLTKKLEGTEGRIGRKLNKMRA